MIGWMAGGGSGGSGVIGWRAGNGSGGVMGQRDRVGEMSQNQGEKVDKVEKGRGDGRDNNFATKHREDKSCTS